jgi:hypothetical protein
MTDDRRYPPTPEEWVEKMKNRGDERLGPADCREYLASVLAMVADAIQVVLFHDPKVKNYFLLPFHYETHPQFDFEVCFRRHDGRYPGDKRALEIFQQARIEDLEKDLEASNEELLKLRRTVHALPPGATGNDMMHERDTIEIECDRYKTVADACAKRWVAYNNEVPLADLLAAEAEEESALRNAGYSLDTKE